MIRKAAGLLFVSLCSIAVLAGAAIAQPAGITVSAAISLKNAFEEIGKLYESRNAGDRVMFNFGASGDLMAQIRGGAPVDVFASAAQKDMDELCNEDLVLKETRADFAANAVVLVVPASSGSSIASFEDLKKAEVKKIAVGNPKTVPVGRYTDDVFRYYRISDMMKDKLIFAENVRQVLDYVARGEVDAGVVYATDAIVKRQDVRIVMTAPDASHKPVVYPIAVVKGSKSGRAAKAFLSFVTSGEGRKILSRHGFKPAGQAK